MARERLIYVPLGGAGEIGMNCYVYGWGAPGKERLIVVDLGVTFPNMEQTPGVDLILPDVGWLEARRDRIEAIFITHAHEDHVGAFGRLFGPLGAPKVYTRPFTGMVARAKLEEQGGNVDEVDAIGPWPHQVAAGPFKVGFMPVPHSIPEASGLVIDTPAGRIVHTGDFKLDANPVVGEPYDPAMWREIAGEGIHALVCDSTNVFSPFPGRSESGLAVPIAELVKTAQGMVVATTFASNVARLKTLAEAGVAAGRSVCVLGRAMQRMLSYARNAGFIDDFPPVIELEDAQDIPRENLMLIVTGSQGERRAASAQLANGKYLGFRLQEGDMFLFSSKTIPGNERGVLRIANALSEMGVEVVDDSSGDFHVSGHANRPDLEEVHGIFNPSMLIPMHGEHRHLKTHADLAQGKGIASQVIANGTVAEISGKAPKVIEHIETGRIYLDGSRLIGAFDGVVLERIRMATRGAVVVSLLFEHGKLLGQSWAECMGMPDTAHNQKSLQDGLEDAIDAALNSAKRGLLQDDDEVEKLVVRTVGKVSRDLVGKKPLVKVLINRLE